MKRGEQGNSVIFASRRFFGDGQPAHPLLNWKDMAENSRLRGYLFAFIATLAVSNVYIFSKAALQEVELIKFGFYWFGFGILWNLLYDIPAKRYRTIAKLNRSTYKVLLLIGSLELVGTTSFFLAIKTVENPAIVSFLANMSPVFTTVLGVAFLKERFSTVEAMGFVFTISGAFIISYQKGGDLSHMFLPGTAFVVLASFVFSISFTVAKRYIRDIDPGILTMNRIVFLFLFSTILLFSTHLPLRISWKAFWNIMVGSLLGPFLTVFSQYSALQYIEASRTVIIGSSKGLFVLLGALIYFGTLPLPHQVVGGIVTILGAILVTTGDRIRIVPVAH
ncbi:MAG: DMT family transporter [Deltaproteobacteria bacterium]|nr:DMT family transporter [Deltaproteobacteria bacterium]